MSNIGLIKHFVQHFCSTLFFFIRGQVQSLSCDLIGYSAQQVEQTPMHNKYMRFLKLCFVATKVLPACFARIAIEKQLKVLAKHPGSCSYATPQNVIMPEVYFMLIYTRPSNIQSKFSNFNWLSYQQSFCGSLLQQQTLNNKTSHALAAILFLTL